MRVLNAGAAVYYHYSVKRLFLGSLLKLGGFRWSG